MAKPEPFKTEAEKIRTAVLVVREQREHVRQQKLASFRSLEDQLEEARGLAEAIDLDVCHTSTTLLSNIKPGTLLGTGKVEELGKVYHDEKIKIVIVDHPLSPVQQRNLEKEWHVKVLDRTGLILEIFGARAQTREGQLQVDLAALSYQRGRLVRSWTHLERQRGGGGFLGGPGETQIESDRRDLQIKIDRLKVQLDEVRRTRSLHRKQRKRNEIPVIALVGYTNAGKSTLFNRLCGADVFAKDLLFATLDPTVRRVELPNQQAVLISDTVGFISNLPTDLIAAFRATLEEVIEADIILHVRDMVHPESDAQKEDVLGVLESLGIDLEDIEEGVGAASPNKDGQIILEVLNKTDLLKEDDARRAHLEDRVSPTGQILISASTGEGLDMLVEQIQQAITRDHTVMHFVIEPAGSSDLYWFYNNGEVLDRIDLESGDVDMKVRLENTAQLPSSLTRYRVS